MGALIKSIPAALATLLVAMATIGPTDAMSNISTWASLIIGADDVPAWLTQKATDAWVIVLSLAFIVIYILTIWSVIPNIRKMLELKRRKRNSPIQISYHNDVNLVGKHGIYKIASTALCAGRPLSKPLITKNLFFIGVSNRGEKTARSVSLSINYLSPPPHLMNGYFISVNGHSTHIDIPPDGEELFTFFMGYDHEDGFHQAEVLSPEHYDAVVSTVENNKNTGGWVQTANSCGIKILRNDGIVAEIKASADDISPDLATVILNTKDRISVNVYRHRRLSKRQLNRLRSGIMPASWTQSLSMAKLRHPIATRH